MRQRESVVSEHPRDDEELQSFLNGDSVLSRRYRQASDEQPPEKVDAAILAASQWAVGAEPGRGDRRYPGPRSGGAAHGGSRWWDRLFSRWGVPLATAAVVVIAATLTLMIERTPELERIEREHDSVALNAPAKPGAEAERSLSGSNGEADAVQSAPAASPHQPTSELAGAKSEEPVAASKPAPPSAPERIAFRPVQEEDAIAAANAVARKQAAERKETAGTTGRPATPAEPVLGAFADNVAPPVAGPAPSSEQKSAVVDIAAPVERRREAEALRVEDGADAQITRQQAAAPVATTPAQVFSPVPMASTETEPADVIAEGATAASPASSEARSAVRDPEQWIADIEEQLALGNRELARAAVRNFRERYPDYKLPDALEKLLPASDSTTDAPDAGNQ